MGLSAEKKISRAIVWLTIHDPVFACILMQMRRTRLSPEEAAEFERVRGFPMTIATDGVAIFYNPDFVDKLQAQELVGVLVHEAMHVMMKHNLRREKRDISLWNIACDYAVNRHIVSSGYKLPGDALISGEYRDMSAEAIYARLAEKKSCDATDAPDYSSTPGAVIDHPQTNVKSVQELEDRADRLIQAAYQAAKSSGSIPKFIERMVGRMRSVPIDYRELLRDWLSKTAVRSDYLWSRPNRRYLESGACLPSLEDEESVARIVFAVDCSGSIDDRELGIFEDQIGHVLRSFPATYHVVYFDTRVTGTQDVDAAEMPIKLKAKGGGGTSYAEVMEYIRGYSAENEVDGVIFFTDLETSRFGDPPGPQVLWMNTCRGNDDLRVPFGTVIPVFAAADPESSS